MSAPRFFPRHAQAAFAELYPTRAGILAHALGDEPLLRLPALADLAEALPHDSVEWTESALPIGVDPAELPSRSGSVGEAIRRIDASSSWVVLKRIEQVRAYRELLRSILGELEHVVRLRTGAKHQVEGFVFVSSPGAVTPFHFDPEHNILLQLRGTKTMTVFPADDETLNPATAQEAFHLGAHHRNLPWREDFAARGTAMTIGPGEAIHVPVKAPHWVRNGPEPSISLSVTWRSDWSYAEADARAFNRVIRRLGMTPRPPASWPRSSRAKATAWRALRRLGT